jgi:hypothetical protein
VTANHGQRHYASASTTSRRLYTRLGRVSWTAAASTASTATTAAIAGTTCTTGRRRQRWHTASTTYSDTDDAAVILASSSATAVASPQQQRQHVRRGSPHQQLWHHLRQAPQRFQEQVFGRPATAPTNPTTNPSSQGDAAPTHDTTGTAPALTLPIFDTAVWEAQTGREFINDDNCDDNVEALVTMAQALLAQQPGDGNPWIAWKEQQQRQSSDDDNNDPAAIDVWTGTSLVPGYGAAVPWIKTQAFVAGVSPRDLCDLLLDSSRVTTYNAWSTGRADLWVRRGATGDDDNGGEDSRTAATTKICRNRTQPPMGANPMESVTLLHARPVIHGSGNGGQSWLLVSRAVGGVFLNDENDNNNNKPVGRSEMLLGVNLFQAIPGRPDATLLTTVTHVYSKAIPLMLAERLGVKSAKQFVQDLRSLGATDTTVKEE